MANKSLTRAILQDKIIEKLSLSPQDAKIIVDGFFAEICQSLIDGEDVKLSGFGNFILKDKRERKGRNPKTNQEVKISARRVVVFKPSSKLRDILQKDFRNKK